MAHWMKSDGLTGRQMLDLPPIWLIGAIALVWLQVWLWPGLTTTFPGQDLLRGVLICSGLGLILWALWAFRRHATSAVPHQMPDQIITSGPFAFSRNPIYLGDLLILVGVIAGYGAWPSLVLVPLLQMILVRRFIAPEEARMKENFGAKFDAFASQTRRWL